MVLKIEHHHEKFISLLTPAPYTYNTNASKNVYTSPVESWWIRTNIEEFLDPYYGSGKSCNEMKDRGCIPKNELNDPIDGYLEDLDKLILKSRKEVLNTYYVPDEPEKNPSQNVVLGLGLDLKPLQMLLNQYNNIMQKWASEKEKCSQKSLDEKSEEETDKMDDVNKTDLDESSQKKEMKENVPVESEEVVDSKFEPILDEKAFSRECELKIKKIDEPRKVINKELGGAAELWMKKVTKLRRTIKHDRENKMKEKKVHHCNINFEKSLDDLVKALEIKPKDISVLEKEENKVKKAAEDQELTYLSQNEKEALIDFNRELKINPNEALKWPPKRVDRNNLTGKCESLEDNQKQYVNIDLHATGVASMVKNQFENKGEEKEENKGIIIMHKMNGREWKENKEMKGVSNSGICQLNQWFRYLPMDWSHIPVFDPGGEVRRSL
ncbi:8370_t:CDS:2 [Gigaspora margarita]|uniref:8370_t:CDS:1 n=1 Tax=Gigaspora margarita TaxID=4874 RepID=A0ABN7USU9_GIGMA|nr:8370_t:CDS:2 [Gigaspora margarita]